MKPPKCRFCGAEHWGLCHDHNAKGAIADQRPKESTAARMDVQQGLIAAGQRLPQARQTAGTQAPPVDTKSAARPEPSTRAAVASTKSSPKRRPKRKRGRVAAPAELSPVPSKRSEVQMVDKKKPFAGAETVTTTGRGRPMLEKSKGKSKRADYQRELMRKKRAAKKAAAATKP